MRTFLEYEKIKEIIQLTNMRIAIIVRKLNMTGGVQRQALSLAREIVNMGHNVKLYTFSYDRENCFPEIIGHMEVIELPKAKYLPTAGFFGFLNENKMAKDLALLMDKDFDILHPHDNVAYHVAYYYKKLVKNIPSVWQMNELLSMRWPPELLKFVEDPKFHDIPWRPYFLKKAVILFKIAYEKSFIKAQNAITVFDTFHQNLLKRYTGCDSFIVPSGIEVEKFPFFLHNPPQKEEKIKLLSSGVFLSYRRYEDIFYAMQKLVGQGYDLHLTILSDYSTDKKYYRLLNELCQKLGLKERVLFFGKYSDQELLDFFAKSHIFVFPHLQSQALSAYEAMVAGLPVIVAPMPGTYETLVHKKNALFFTPKDVDGLAQAIKELIDNKQLYLQISKQGAQSIRDNFSWADYTKRMLVIFNKVLAL